MMKNITKATRFLLILALLALGVFLVACQSGSNDPDAIYFAKEHTPKRSYVRGQDLDFTDILLTCTVKGEATTIPMDTEGVTVSGYDKDTLGEQTVTVTYKEKTTSFKVTVVPRITVEGYEANYFVGDEFNKQNGRIKLANDDGSVTTVNMKDDTVFILDFDSSVEGTKNVTVSYNGYTDTFKVNILKVEQVKLNSPTKKAYQSHETEFSVAGGYFTVTSEGGVITKTVPVTQDMVVESSFDPTVATIENRTAATAAKQTVRIEYLGHSFEMEISIRYSGVSIVTQSAKDLANVDYTKPVAEADGVRAIDAMNEFLELSKADQALIDKADRNLLARIACVYAYDTFEKEVAKLSHTFTLEEGERTDANNKFVEYCGYFTVSCDSYDNMLITLEAMKDKNSTFNTMADFLHVMEEEFEGMKIVDDITIDEYFKALFLKEDHAYVLDLFKQMVAIYEEMMVVPENWDRESIKAPAMVEGIEDAYMRIITSNFPITSYPDFYRMISVWRAKNDFYDIIHTHYLYNKTYSGENESYATYVWEKILFPGKLQTLYDNIAMGFTLSSYMKNSVHDTTDFMVVYHDVQQLVKAIHDEGNTLYMDIYNTIDFDKLIDGYLYSASSTGLYAYRHVVGTLLYDSATLNYFWDDYFAIVDLVKEDGTVDMKDPTTAKAIEKMFTDFFALTPFERFQIICTLYSNYKELNIEGFAFDYSNGVTGNFISLIAYYYTGEDGVLPESTHALFQKLMIATEQYGIRYKQLSAASGAVDAYIALMKEVQTLYNGLSDADRAAFNKYAEAAYVANLQVYNAITATAPGIETYPELGEMKSVLASYYTILAEIMKDSTAANDKGTYALLFTAYEKACTLRDAILESGDEAMLHAYRTFNYIVINADDENENNNYSMTLEAVFDLINGSAHGYTLTVTHDDGTKESFDAVEYYTAGGLAEFLADSYKVLYTAFIGEENTREDVLAIMAQYRALGKDAVALFYSLNLDACYYSAMEAFLTNALAQDSAAAALATALLEAEREYAGYALDTEDEEAKADFVEAWAAVETAKAAVDTTSEAYTTLLQQLYDYYLAAYQGMNQNA